MAKMEYESVVNLTDLRDELCDRLGLCLIGLSWAGLLYAVFFRGQVATIGLLVSLLVLGVGVRVLANARPAMARHLLVWGLTVSMMATMWLFSDLWVPFLSLLLVFSAAMLISWGGVAIAATTAFAATWLTYSQERAYPLPGLFMALVLGVVVTWLLISTLYTALQWTWNMNRRANHFLKVVRDQQVELKRTVKSLEQVNALQRRIQYELVLARKRAEEARRVTEQFAANISHELRTPLNLILGFSEVMQLSPEVYGEMRWSPKLREAVYYIYRSSRHLMGLIDDILDLSRFDMGGEALNYEPTPLGPLLRDTVEIVEDLFQGHQVRLEVEIPDDLPTLNLDCTRIRQVLLNLLNNARRFTEEGLVRLEVKQGDGEVVISVSDTGPGIPADELSDIFKEFYQVDRSLHRSHGGTGLGLAICRRFVEAHQGRIWVESQEGVGSIFYFTLPRSDQHVSASSLYVPGPLEPSWPAIRPPVLVVDSDPGVAALLRRHIGKYEVIQVEDVDRLDEEIMLHHPQAVVCNVPPGKGDDHEAAISVPVPFIECSLPSQAWAADNLAVVACLTKPITVDQILGELNQLEGIHDVLVVDDEQGFCQLVEHMLETSGQAFEIRYAHNGEDGLRAMRARRPDLVLLDLVMPRLDGFQVLEEMRREAGLADVSVILLTATSLFDDALARRSSQIVISRPDGLHLDEVLDCLQAVLGVLEPRFEEQ
jgi:signal transduction histidine kinase/CheY-like chemotaxis protein